MGVSVVLPVKLTLDQAQAFVLEQGAALAQGGAGEVRVDASGLQQFDSSALAALLELRRQALSSGKTFTLTGQPKRLDELAGLYGVNALLAPV